jgi:hypothetical protein
MQITADTRPPGVSTNSARLSAVAIGLRLCLAAWDYLLRVLGTHPRGTRPVAPGPVDDDLADHDAATVERLFALSTPDWSDLAAVAECAAARVAILGDDRAIARATAAGFFDRSPSMQPAAQMATSCASCSPSSTARRDGESVCPRWRYRNWRVSGPSRPLAPPGGVVVRS